MLQATYVGADALTVEQSVATPLEQQMSGVDHMLYMYSVNGSNGQTTLRVDFDVASDPNVDQLLTQMRYAQAESQLPSEVRSYGVTIRKSSGVPMLLFSLYSPKGTFDARFLANYVYINLADPIARDPGVTPGDRLRRRAIRHAIVGEAGSTCRPRRHGERGIGCREQPKYWSSR